MTFVGPRPEMPFLVRKYKTWQHLAPSGHAGSDRILANNLPQDGTDAPSGGDNDRISSTCARHRTPPTLVILAKTLKLLSCLMGSLNTLDVAAVAASC